MMKNLSNKKAVLSYTFTNNTPQASLHLQRSPRGVTF